MEEEKKPRRTHVKIIHHHIHHYHYHRKKENDDNILQQKEIHNKQSIYMKNSRKHRHHHRHHHDHYPQEDDGNQNRPNEPNDYSDYNSRPPSIPDDDNDNYKNLPNNHNNNNNPPNRSKPRKPKKVVTYYIPESPEPNFYDILSPNIQNAKPKKRPKSSDRGKFPYPMEKLPYLKRHPLPDNDDDPMPYGYPKIESPRKNSPRREPPAKQPTKIRFITDYPKYSRPKNVDYNYWTDIEAVLVQERLGGYVEIPPKQLPMMYPFTQMSPRKLPWDFSDVELVPTRPNKPVKPYKPKSFSYYEESILEMLRIPTPGNRVISVSPRSDEFEFIESWIKTCLWHPFKKLTQLTRLGLSSQFLEFERSYSRIHLVLFPCDYPLKYADNPLPQMMVTHRCVTNGYDLIHLLKKIKKIKVSFLLCAADLGNQAIDYHPKCIPTQYRLNSLIASEFDSLFYRESGVESIMIFDPSRVVPLYACQLSYR